MGENKNDYEDDAVECQIMLNYYRTEEAQQLLEPFN